MSPEGSQESNFHASSGQQFYPDIGSDAGYKIALKISDVAADLYEQVKKLKEINAILSELVQKDKDLSTTLKFTGILPAFDDAEYAAQTIIDEKLRIPLPVLNATRNSDKSITFQLANVDDKIYLIRTAKKALAGSKIMLVY